MNDADPGARELSGVETADPAVRKRLVATSDGSATSTVSLEDLAGKPTCANAVAGTAAPHTLPTMSTHFDITGSVRLDDAAFSALLESDSRHWIGLSPSHGTLTVTRAGGAWYLEADSCFRNLRQLDTDLRAAQGHGDVDGALHIECTDGSCYQSVVVYTGRTCLAGETSCLNGPVRLRPAEITSFPIGDYTVLSLTPQRGTAADDGPGRWAHATATTDCSCGGWADEPDDGPLCENDTDEQPADGAVIETLEDLVTSEPGTRDESFAKALVDLAAAALAAGANDRFARIGQLLAGAPGAFHAWIDLLPPTPRTGTVRWTANPYDDIHLTVHRPVGQLDDDGRWTGWIHCEPGDDGAITLDPRAPVGTLELAVELVHAGTTPALAYQAAVGAAR